MEVIRFIKPTWKKVGIFFAIVILFSLIFFLIAGTIPFWYAVSSNAMSPAYHYGDMIFVKKVNFNELKNSDVVVYNTPQARGLLIMRIISIDYSNNAFTTKGDNNPQSLPFEIKVPSSSIKCKGIFSLPLVGYFDIVHIGWLIRVILIYLITCVISQYAFKIRAVPHPKK